MTSGKDRVHEHTYEVEHFFCNALYRCLPCRHYADIGRNTCNTYVLCCGLVVRVPDYTSEMYCVSCEVRSEFIYVM
jgi:hypothetical protein